MCINTSSGNRRSSKTPKIKLEDPSSQDHLLANDPQGNNDHDDASDSGTIDNTSTTSRTYVPPTNATPPRGVVAPLESHAPSQDEDVLFALSLVPGLKRLRPPQKLAVKIRLLQAVHEGRFQGGQGGSVGGQGELMEGQGGP